MHEVTAFFSNDYWWVDCLRVGVLITFALALLALPSRLRHKMPERQTNLLSGAMALLLISAMSRTSAFFGDPMVWDRTPFLLGAGILMAAWLWRDYRDWRYGQFGRVDRAGISRDQRVASGIASVERTARDQRRGAA